MYLLSENLMDKYDIFSVSICNNDLAFSIRVYKDSTWGKRQLGPGRFAIDFGRVSLIFENYGVGRK